MAEARVANLKAQLKMKEDIAHELKAAFDRRNELETMYAPVKHLTQGVSALLSYPPAISSLFWGKFSSW